MIKGAINIACTRILDEDLKATAASKGLSIDDRAFLSYSYLDTPQIRQTLLENKWPLVFTSQHAVYAVNKLQFPLQNKLVYCTSGKTAQLIVKTGAQIEAKAANASALAKEILKHQPQGILHLTSNISRPELATALTKAGITIQAVEVYHKAFSPAEIPAFQGILFFSPSQITSFLSKNHLESQIPAFCIGATTATFLKNQGHKNIHIATAPSPTAVLEKVYQYFNLN